MYNYQIFLTLFHYQIHPLILLGISFELVAQNKQINKNACKPIYTAFALSFQPDGDQYSDTLLYLNQEECAFACDGLGSLYFGLSSTSGCRNQIEYTSCLCFCYLQSECSGDEMMKSSKDLDLTTNDKFDLYKVVKGKSPCSNESKSIAIRI